MSEPTHEQIVSELLSKPPIALAPGPRLDAEPHGELPLPPSTVWDLPGGTAWVYYGEGHTGLTRPVIFADGFNTGPSSLDFSWEIMEFGDYALISELRRRGHDVILLGFHERSASILDNSRTAQAAILHAIAERQSNTPLAVGGFSMGGLVTRHALAKMESQGIDHQTSLYFSYDSPHRGAWIPIALQAFAHYIKDLDSRFSDQINSPAARQLLWRHIDRWDGTPDQSDERAAFLAEMRAVGEWPHRPRLIGVANGVANGTGTDVQPGELALEGKGLSVVGTKLYTQAPGDHELVAKLRVVTLKTNEVHVRTPVDRRRARRLAGRVRHPRRRAQRPEPLPRFQDRCAHPLALFRTGRQRGRRRRSGHGRGAVQGHLRTPAECQWARRLQTRVPERGPHPRDRGALHLAPRPAPVGRPARRTTSAPGTSWSGADAAKLYRNYRSVRIRSPCHRPACRPERPQRPSPACRR